MSKEELVQKYYIGFYGRPADPEGVQWWADKMESEGTSQVLEDFADSDEAEEFVFTDPETGEDYEYEALVHNIYDNLFGRDAESAGLEFYVGQLESGEMDEITIVQNVMDGAQDQDLEIFENKLEVAEYFTGNLDDKEYGKDQIMDARSVLNGRILDVDQAKAAADITLGRMPEVNTAYQSGGFQVEDSEPVQTSMVSSSYDGSHQDEGVQSVLGTAQENVSLDLSSGQTETLTIIPEGTSNVEVEKTGSTSLDLTLTAGGEKIVHWSSGQISGFSGGSTTYNGADIEWNGYGSNPETLTIEGEVPQDMELKVDAFGPGSADVEYSLGGDVNGDDDPVPNGDTVQGDQSVDLSGGQTEHITVIPEGASNVEVEKTGSTSLDLTLTAGGEKIVHWSSGQISGFSGGSTTYNGADIEWNGYGSNPETLTIEGEVPQDMELKVDAFGPGSADVEYSWDGDGEDDNGIDIDPDPPEFPVPEPEPEPVVNPESLELATDADILNGIDYVYNQEGTVADTLSWYETQQIVQQNQPWVHQDIESIMDATTEEIMSTASVGLSTTGAIMKTGVLGTLATSAAPWVAAGGTITGVAAYGVGSLVWPEVELHGDTEIFPTVFELEDGSFNVLGTILPGKDPAHITDFVVKHDTGLFSEETVEIPLPYLNDPDEDFNTPITDLSFEQTLDPDPDSSTPIKETMVSELQTVTDNWTPYVVGLQTDFDADPELNDDIDDFGDIEVGFKASDGTTNLVSLDDVTPEEEIEIMGQANFDGMDNMDIV